MWRSRSCSFLGCTLILASFGFGQTRVGPRGGASQEAPSAREIQPQFVEVGSLRGLGACFPEAGMACGFAAADYDNDGDVDVFVPNAHGPEHQLYRNDGNGNFLNVASAAGLASRESGRSALWFDYDGDRRLDLLISRDDELLETTYSLYRQRPSGRFDDVTVQAGLTVATPGHRGGMCAGDIDNDGLLDFYAANWAQRSHLFRNVGDGTFEDISISSGVVPVDNIRHWQPCMADFNGDGWLDLYVTVDFAYNELWINQQDGTFVNLAVLYGCNNSMNDMGLSVLDYDNDGDFDLYISNIFDWTGVGEHNVLYRNDSIGASLSFTDVAQAVGVDDGAWGWGVTGLDYDNDGDLDLAATNGFFSETWPADRSLLWRQDQVGGSSFRELGVASGVHDTLWGSNLVSFDYDRDGDLDLMQICMDGVLLLLENQQSSLPTTAAQRHNHLVVQPRQGGTNYYAIGSVVRVQVGEVQMSRLITAGTSLAGQEPAEAFFGLGNASSVDEVRVEFPDGSTTVLNDVAANQLLVVNDS